MAVDTAKNHAEGNCKFIAQQKKSNNPKKRFTPLF
jgi:hypothetical protein